MKRLAVLGAVVLAVAFLLLSADFQLARVTTEFEALVDHSPAAGVNLGGAQMPQLFIDPSVADGDQVGAALLRALELSGLLGVEGVPGWTAPRPTVVRDREELDPGRPVLAVYECETRFFYTPVFARAEGRLRIGLATSPGALPPPPPQPFSTTSDGPGEFTFRSEVAGRHRAVGLITWPAYRSAVLRALAATSVQELVAALDTTGPRLTPTPPGL